MLLAAVAGAFLLASGGAHAGDPVAGMALFNDIPDSVISCGNVACHGPNPNNNINGLQKAGNNGGVIQNAIRSGVTQMMFLNGLLNPFQLDDIAAYLAPQPMLSGDAVDFGAQSVGSVSAPQSVTLQNGGGVNLAVTSLSLGGPNAGDFDVAGTCGQGVILQSTTIEQSAGTCSIVLRFHPTATGSRSASVTLAYGGMTTFPSTQTIVLSGTADAQLLPQASLSTKVVDFGEVRVGDASLPSTITLANTGNGPLAVDAIALGGSAGGDFRLSGSCLTTAVLPPAGQCAIEVVFVPTDLDLRTAALSIALNAGGGPAVVALSGVGITFACTPPAPPAESRVLACTTGQQGSLQQTRTWSCFNKEWAPDPWITVANNCHAALPSADLPLTEFFNSDLMHYFMTAESTESIVIDSGGAGPGWARTQVPLGRVWSTASDDSALVSVCRFYGNPALGPDGRRRGPNSHFYTADPAECAAVRVDEGWVFEGIVFRVMAAVGGACPQGTLPVLREYNGRFAENDSNHRYTIDPVLAAAMTSEGWSAEGVVFCVAAP